MLFGGFQRTTLVDYPGRVASIAFVVGCNMRCHYCYNTDLVFGKAQTMDEEFILSSLEARKHLVDAVVVTGGEPTIWKDLPLFLARLKSKGFSIKLDTNGTNPGMLGKILEEGLADYVAMDIKAPWESYRRITGVQLDISKIIESMRLIREKAPDYEFRTTLAPGLTKDDIAEMARQISPAKRWLLQDFSPKSQIINPEVLSLPKLSAAEAEIMLKGAEQCRFEECKAR